MFLACSRSYGSGPYVGFSMGSSSIALVSHTGFVKLSVRRYRLKSASGEGNVVLLFEPFTGPTSWDGRNSFLFSFMGRDDGVSRSMVS